MLLALYQGARFLQPQLDSIARQTGVIWSLHVNDDGSTDTGPRLVDDFALKWPGRVDVRSGPAKGAVANFCDMLRTAPSGDYCALADQDDVWFDDKLARAVSALAAEPALRPAIYCSRVVICDDKLSRIGLSRLPKAPPSFRHALVQNLVQGNTLVMNRAAQDLVRAALQLAGPVVMHDWFIYQIVSGSGGLVIYDPKPSLCYRQHADNVVGANAGWLSRVESFRRMLRGQYGEWSRQNLAALSACVGLLTPENRALLDQFGSVVHGGLAQRLAALRKAGLYRQDALSNAALWFAAALGRV